jgi:cytochrome oxidase Cu insertion factor (SCO1/SenC/PrrC family)
VTNKRLWAIVAVVVVPWLLAIWMVKQPGVFSLTPEVHGDLFQTPVQVSDLNVMHDHGAFDAKGHWWLLQVANGCDQACHDTMGILHQIHVALGKEADRVQRGIIALAKPKSGSKVGHQDAQLAYLYLQQSSASKVSLWHNGGIYVVDPLGNVVMRFDAKVSPKLLLKDMKWLLRGSHIG